MGEGAIRSGKHTHTNSSRKQREAGKTDALKCRQRNSAWEPLDPNLRSSLEEDS